MEIRVNGECRKVSGSFRLADLLAELNLPPEGIAVAVNDAVVARADYAVTQLRDRDVIEIIHAVGGGSPGCLILAHFPPLPPLAGEGQGEGGRMDNLSAGAVRVMISKR